MKILGKIFSFKKSKVSIAFIISLVIFLGASGFFIARQYTKANADYICTKITDNTTGCTEDVSKVQPNYECKDGKYQRTLLGLRLKTTTTFAWRRTSCPAGFTQTSRGRSGGDSGFISDTENVVLEYQSCPILDIGLSCGGGGTSCTPKDGEFRNDKGECVPVPPIDLCTNDGFPGIQSLSHIASSSLTYNPIERTCANKDTDICKNIAGPQISLPNSWYGPDARGDCHPIVSEIKDVKISLGINCSTNNGTTWNDCSRVVLPSRSQPIKLRGVIDGVADKLGGYEWSDPEKAGQPEGYFDGKISSETSKLRQPLLNLNFVSGNKFTKDVELKFTDLTTGKYNNITKSIEITIASQDVIIER